MYKGNRIEILDSSIESKIIELENLGIEKVACNFLSLEVCSLGIAI